VRGRERIQTPYGGGHRLRHKDHSAERSGETAHVITQARERESESESERERYRKRAREGKEKEAEAKAMVASRHGNNEHLACRQDGNNEHVDDMQSQSLDLDHTQSQALMAASEAPPQTKRTAPKPPQRALLSIPHTQATCFPTPFRSTRLRFSGCCLTFFFQICLFKAMLWSKEQRKAWLLFDEDV